MCIDLFCFSEKDPSQLLKFRVVFLLFTIIYGKRTLCQMFQGSVQVPQANPKLCVFLVVYSLLRSSAVIPQGVVFNKSEACVAFPLCFIAKAVHAYQPCVRRVPRLRIESLHPKPPISVLGFMIQQWSQAEWKFYSKLVAVSYSTPHVDIGGLVRALAPVLKANRANARTRPPINRVVNSDLFRLPKKFILQLDFLRDDTTFQMLQEVLLWFLT